MGRRQSVVESHEARRVFFADPLAVYLDDGSGANRTMVIGASIRDRVLLVVHIERGARDRIITARAATNMERHIYESRGDP